MDFVFLVLFESIWVFFCVFVLFCFTVAVCVFKVVFASFWCPCGGFCLFFCLLFLASLQLDYMSLLSLFLS